MRMPYVAVNDACVYAYGATVPLFGTTPSDLLAKIFDNLGVAIAVVNDDKSIVYINDTALNLFRVDRAALPMKLEGWSRNYRFIDSEGQEITLENAAIVRTLSGEYVGPQNMRMIFSDGKTKWLHTCSYRFSVMGLSGAVLTATDETAVVELEQSAAQARRIEALGALAGALAHDFNNLISIINLSAFVGLNDPQTGEEARERFAQIASASRRTADWTKRLVQFSRKQDLQRKPTSINELLQNVAVLVEPIMRNGIKLVTEMCPNLPQANVDEAEIEQVLVNLVMNARDAMPHGGVLTISTALAAGDPSDIAGDREKQCVKITVSDTGCGIPEEIQSHIFEPYFTTKPRDKGTGLGLASAHGIVLQHHGRIEVQSAIGRGTTFTIYLPLR
jgi:signal transduction histidine kinase